MSEVITTSIYGGKATISFTEGKHLYTVDVPSKGVVKLWQPSVTKIIGTLDKSDALVGWAVGQMLARTKELLATDTNEMMAKSILLAVLDSAKQTWRQTRDEAANMGSIVHDFLETELKHRSDLGPSPTLPIDMPEEYRERVTNAIGAGMRFFDKHKIRIIQAEMPRWSATHGYIGTGDLIAFVDGEMTVLDYKTSKRLYPTVFLQLAAYQMAFQEEFPGEKITKRLGVNVCRDGRLDTDERDNVTLKSDFEAFLALRTAWAWARVNDAFEPKSVPDVVGPIN